MNLLEAALRRIIADLDSLNVKWAIVGGLAVGARGRLVLHLEEILSGKT